MGGTEKFPGWALDVEGYHRHCTAYASFKHIHKLPVERRVCRGILYARVLAERGFERQSTRTHGKPSQVNTVPMADATMLHLPDFISDHRPDAPIPSTVRFGTAADGAHGRPHLVCIKAEGRCRGGAVQAGLPALDPWGLSRKRILLCIVRCLIEVCAFFRHLP